MTVVGFKYNENEDTVPISTSVFLSEENGELIGLVQPVVDDADEEPPAHKNAPAVKESGSSNSYKHNHLKRKTASAVISLSNSRWQAVSYRP